MITGLRIIKPDKPVLGVTEGYQFNQDLTLELADRIGALGSQFDVVEFALGGGVLVADSGLDSSAVDSNVHDSSFLFLRPPGRVFVWQEQL